MPQHKSFHCAEFKVLDEEQGVFSAYISVFDVLDHAKERVRPGFFAESIAKKAPKVVLYHDWNRPIGKTLVAEEHLKGDPRLPAELKGFGGLYTEVQLNLDTQDGREAFSHLKFGSLDEFSFGYDVEERERFKDGTSDLIKGTIYELSPVLIGCNPATRLVGTKELTDGPLSLADLRKVAEDAFFAALNEADSDEDTKTTLYTEFKDVFSLPAPAAGRLYEQLDAALAAVKSVTDRFERYAQTKEADGRIPSPDRREQLVAIHEAIGALLAKTAPPEPLDLDLLREISIARKRRIDRAIGAQHA
jgi:HK97 family phage prohead protease